MKSKGLLKANSFGKKRNFLTASKAKAGEGFRILMNWSSNSCTLRGIIAATLGFGTIVLVLLYDQSRLLRYEQQGICDCFNRDVATMNNSSVFGARRPNTAILYLPKPERSFHGNHWFHIGEHYISRRGAIQEMLAQYQHQGGGIEHLKIVVQDPKLANMMTKMSFSLIVMTCLSAIKDQRWSSLQSIELFKEPDVDIMVVAGPAESILRIDKLAVSQRTRFIARKDPLFGYYKDDTADNMIVEYRGESNQQAATTPMLAIGAQSDIPQGNGASKKKHKCRKQPSPTLEDMYRRFTQPLFVDTPPTTQPTVDCVPEACICGVYMGAVGHTPVPSYDWFHSTEEADQLRSTALSMCGIPETALGLSGPGNSGTVSAVSAIQSIQVPRKLTLLIYQRDLNRRFVHLHGIKLALQERSNLLHAPSNVKHEWDVRVIKHNENAAPCDLYKTLHSADILLTAHGFQSTALMFMRKGAMLLEIFPYKYHRTSYYPLSQRFGLHYRSIQNTAPIDSHSGLTGLVASLATGTPSAQLLKMVSQGACMRDLKCRSYARSRDITMPTSHMELVLQTMEDVERGRLDLFAADNAA